MSAPIESVILCEGFHDRAFWKGCLEHLGCRDARPAKDAPAIDPFGKEVRRDFAFLSPSGAFLRVSPCNGDREVLRLVRLRLKQRTTNGLARMLVNFDLDAMEDAPEADRRDDLRKRVQQAVERAVGEGAAGPVRAGGWMERPDGTLEIDGGATLVSVVLWCAEDPPTPELPGQQTLERLVCAALRAAYPERAVRVAAWLASREVPSPPPPAEYAKSHAWSHMAGWYSAHGCDDFYQAVWRDPAVAGALGARLRALGAWDAITAFAR